MAKFVVELTEGKFGVSLEGSPGEDLSADQVLAYSMTQVGHSLARIADQLESSSENFLLNPDATGESVQ
ncbi:MAG: hypothetical protein CMI67_25820 [Pelagibaca sp.]|nr:hypothetical protein [Pelagibaca sp.]|tara:strand:+ start:795 stop:1001 length:207 start_codon:yes stop_codon:yes gene_type:complete